MSHRNALHTVNPKDSATYLENPYPSGFSKVSVTPATKGDAKVDMFSVTADEIGLFNLREIRDGGRHRIVPPGTYTRLSIGGSLVMTDTPAEAYENRPPVLNTHKGALVLVNGLGLGFVLAAILTREPSRVVVIERNKNVIDLVGPSITDKRVWIIHGDAFKVRPSQYLKKGERYAVAWHDIWNDHCEDNLPAMHKLKRRFARAAKWQGCWSQDEEIWR